MAVVKTYTPDGPSDFHYAVDGHAVVTGPISGHVALADGTIYDVTEHVIEVASLAHAGEVAHHIGIRHEAEEHPLHDPAEPFVHVCSPACGPVVRHIDDTVAAYEARVDVSRPEHADRVAALHASHALIHGEA